MEFDKSLVFNDVFTANWLFQQYGRSNFRYPTFQVALNWLHQMHRDPVIVETGCQRQENDLGAGMSTSIFAEYIKKYGGSLISIDNNAEHINRAKSYVQKFNANVTFICADSLGSLKTLAGPIHLLYLDSVDFPIYEDEETQLPSQKHCLAELKIGYDKVCKNGIILIDDNTLDNGGKPKLAKQWLINKAICLYDSQQTLWLKQE